MLKVAQQSREQCKHNRFYSGVTVCDAWQDDPVSFIEWAHENGYDESLFLTRKDQSEGYRPDNCEWSERPKSGKRLIEYHGETIPFCEFVRQHTNVDYHTAYERMDKGWTLDEIAGIYNKGMRHSKTEMRKQRAEAN